MLKTDHLFIIGDLNTRVRNAPITNIVGTQGESIFNNNGKTLRGFLPRNVAKAVKGSQLRDSFPEIAKMQWGSCLRAPYLGG